MFHVHVHEDKAMAVLIKHLWYRELWYYCWVIWYGIYSARFIRTVYRLNVSHVLDFYG